MLKALRKRREHAGKDEEFNHRDGNSMKGSKGNHRNKNNWKWK
jgi:hypothetical protein